MRKVINWRAPTKNARLPMKVWKQKSGLVSQAWKWASDADHRRRKHYRMGLNDRMVYTVYDFLAKRNATTARNTCVPFALYKFHSFGFNNEIKPAWTIYNYLAGRGNK